MSKILDITDPKAIVDDWMEPAKNVKSEFVKETQQFTKKQMTELIESVANYYAIPNHIALLGVFSSLQRGGTSRNKKSNVKIRFGQTTFESRIINAYIVKANKNFTPRQFARYFANEIYDLCRIHDIKGNCYEHLSKNTPYLITGNQDEVYWASDFQVDNENCPSNIRNGLNIRYNSKFNRSLQNKEQIKRSEQTNQNNFEIDTIHGRA